MVAEVRPNRNPLSAPIDDKYFRKLAEGIPTLCWIADADGYIMWYNRRWYEYTGKTPAEMEGWGWQSVHEPKSLAEVLDRWKSAISSAQPFEMVFPIRGADGVLRPFLTRISPAFDESGAVTNWFGVNTDISPQIEAEDAVVKSEAKFRVLADSMPQMVWSSSPDGLFDYFNARWYEFTGAPIGSTDGDGWSAMLHPEDLQPTIAAWRHAVDTGEALHREFRLRDRSGDYRWVLGRAQPDRAAGGQILRWYGSFTDIEDIVQARHVLKRSRDELGAEVIARTGERNLLATVVETTDVMIMALDLDYNILAINKANADEFERVYGRRARVGDNVLALLEHLPEQRAAAQAAWGRALAGEEVTLIEAHGDPARVRSDYEIKFRTLRNEAGEQIGAFQFVEDVTQRLRDQAMLAHAQEALLQSQKLESMGQLTGGVAHDFNNLLTPIIATLDLLQRLGTGGDRVRRLVNGAYQSAERAKILVHRLLAFARRQPLQRVPIDIGALIRGLADLIASTTGPQVARVFTVADDLPAASADPSQLEMAIINLSVNARDAMDGVGTLRISATLETTDGRQMPQLEPGRYIRIVVADTGRGMDEVTRSRAIEPFFSTKGVGKGTGLGLSMAHGLAAQLGGALTIDSEPGVGTEVAIWLPESPEVSRPATVARVQGSPSNTGTILVVDDEEYIRVATVDMLTELGFTVREAATAEAALEVIDAGFKPDILITDHLMPGMTGVELAYTVRARQPGVKLLIVSGFAEAEGIDPSLPRLTKPFVQSELLRHIYGERDHRPADHQVDWTPVEARIQD
jgi:PAS domain S-box-containing protein